MAELLELNIRAKHAAPPPPPPNAHPVGQSLLVEHGKKYITYGGRVITITISEKYGIQSEVGYHEPDGRYSNFPPTYPYSIRMEWFSTWKEFDAWLAGIPVQWSYKAVQPHVWSLIENDPAVLSNNPFLGPDGIVGWWLKSFEDGPQAALTARIAP